MTTPADPADPANTVPDAQRGMTKIPLYLQLGVENPADQIGAFVMPVGHPHPTRGQLAELLHEVANHIATTPDGVHIAQVVRVLGP